VLSTPTRPVSEIVYTVHNTHEDDELGCNCILINGDRTLHFAVVSLLYLLWTIKMGASSSRSNIVGNCSKLLLLSFILLCATKNGLSAYNNPISRSSSNLNLSSGSSSSFRKFPKLLHFARGKDTMTHRPNHVPFSLLWAYGYRRGEEIWPPTNVEKPVQLKDSFPLGYVPSPTSVPQKIMEHYTNSSSTTSNSTSTRVNGEERGRIKKILGRASRFQLAKLTDSVDIIPAAISIILGLMRLVHPTDGWFVFAFSAYVTFLYKWSQQPTSSDQRKGSRRAIRNTFLMPALPPQGHVPFLVSNPLGRAMVNSSTYKVWIRIGWISGLVLPISYVAWNLVLLFRNNIRLSSTFEVLPKFISSLRLCGSPIFLFCTQKFSESVALHLLVSFFFKNYIF
jgi:hypothetical protein